MPRKKTNYFVDLIRFFEQKLWKLGFMFEAKYVKVKVFKYL